MAQWALQLGEVSARFTNNNIDDWLTCIESEFDLLFDVARGGQSHSASGIVILDH